MSNDTLANRIVRLLSANAHAMLDSLEGRNPEAMMNQFIRELDEAIESGNKAQVEAELGDVLFALVNLARHTGVDAEGALRRTIDKFTGRFDHVESRVREAHGGWPTSVADDRLTLEELDGYWDEAKRAEAAGKADRQ